MRTATIYFGQVQKMNNYTPKYVIVQNYIKDKIKSGVLKPGDKVPSEHELSNMFKVSRVTINSAITQLRIQGIVESIRGKGTFVKSADDIFLKVDDDQKPPFKISSRGHNDNHKLISAEILTTGEDKTNKLMLLPGEKYHRITRLMYAQDKVISVEYLYFPYEFYPNEIDEAVIEGSYLYSFLEEYCNKKPKYMHTHIDITYPDELEQKYLKAYKNEPLLLWYSAVIDSNDMVLGYTENCARPNDFRPYLRQTL